MNATHFAIRTCTRLILSWWMLSAGLALSFNDARAAGQSYRYDNVERVVAIGDVHGGFPEMVGVLQGAKVIDNQLRWIGGKTHLVSTGDLLSRGDQERQVVELLMRLQTEASNSGGAVHVLLGNHEIMSLTGDLRYVSPGGFAAFTNTPATTNENSLLPAGFSERQQAFAPNGKLGQWLLQRPLMIRINDDLFVHGGLSSALKGMSLKEINENSLRDVRAFAENWHLLMGMGAIKSGDDFDLILNTARTLAKDSTDKARQLAAQALLQATKGLPFQSNGPAWYRGSSLCHPYFEQPELESILAGLGVRRLIIGHTPTTSFRISSRMEGKVLRMDTGMNRAIYHGNPAALIIEGNQATAHYLEGGGSPIKIESHREWNRPYGMSDAEIEDFLFTASITKTEELGTGITKPRRLTLEKNGRKMRAVFKFFDSDPWIERHAWSPKYNLADRYQYEMAAYKIDRLLGLELVPVAVLRKVDGTEGLVQYWVEKSVSDTDRVNKKMSYDGDCDQTQQRNLMAVFDILIQNVDRNSGNLLYDPDWQIWLIDHTRAFGALRGPPKELRYSVFVVNQPMAEALKTINEPNLLPLKKYLNQKQIQALILRARDLRDRR